MTGSEFREAIKRLGLTQKDVANRLGVNQDTITARCRDAELPPLYRYALLGLQAEALKPVLDNLSLAIGSIAAKEQNQSFLHPEKTLELPDL